MALGGAEACDGGPGLCARKVRVTVRELDQVAGVLGRPIDGILGYPAFRGVLLTFDYPAGELRACAGSLAPDEPGVLPAPGKRPFVDATIGERNVNLLLDTGKSGALSLAEPSRFRWATEPIELSATARINGMVVSRAGRLADDFTFGPLQLERPIAANAHRSSLLGAEAMKDFVVTFDPKRGLVRFTRPDGEAASPVSAPPPLRSLRIAGRMEDGGYRVRRFFSPSAAEEAGVQIDDLVLSLDGFPMGSCTSAGEALRDRERVTIRLERNGKILELESSHPIVVE